MAADYGKRKPMGIAVSEPIGNKGNAGGGKALTPSQVESCGRMFLDNERSVHELIWTYRCKLRQVEHAIRAEHRRAVSRALVIGRLRAA